MPLGRPRRRMYLARLEIDECTCCTDGTATPSHESIMTSKVWAFFRATDQLCTKHAFVRPHQLQRGIRAIPIGCHMKLLPARHRLRPDHHGQQDENQEESHFSFSIRLEQSSAQGLQKRTRRYSRPGNSCQGISCHLIVANCQPHEGPGHFWKASVGHSWRAPKYVTDSTCFPISFRSTFAPVLFESFPWTALSIAYAETGLAQGGCPPAVERHR